MEPDKAWKILQDRRLLEERWRELSLESALGPLSVDRVAEVLAFDGKKCWVAEVLACKRDARLSMERIASFAVVKAATFRFPSVFKGQDFVA